MEFSDRVDLPLSKSFSVFVQDAVVAFHPSDQSYIEVHAITQSKPKLECDTETFRFGGCDYTLARVFVYGQFDNLFVHLEKGALVVGKFNLKRLKVSSSRAHVTMFGIVEHCDIKTAMGNVTIHHPCGGVISTWVGKVNVAGGVREPLLVNTIAGDVCAPKGSKIMCNNQQMLCLY